MRLHSAHKLQDAATSGNGSPKDMQGHSAEVSLYVKWAASTTVGTVVIETASDSADTAWATLLTKQFTGSAPKQEFIQMTGCFKWLRARITVTVDQPVTVLLYATSF